MKEPETAQVGELFIVFFFPTVLPDLNPEQSPVGPNENRDGRKVHPPKVQNPIPSRRYNIIKQGRIHERDSGKKREGRDTQFSGQFSGACKLVAISSIPWFSPEVFLVFLWVTETYIISYQDSPYPFSFPLSY